MERIVKAHGNREPNLFLRTVPSHRPRLLLAVLSASATIILTQRWPRHSALAYHCPHRPRSVMKREIAGRRAGWMTSILGSSDSSQLLPVRWTPIIMLDSSTTTPRQPQTAPCSGSSSDNLLGSRLLRIPALALAQNFRVGLSKSIPLLSLRVGLSCLGLPSASVGLGPLALASASYFPRRPRHSTSASTSTHERGKANRKQTSK